MGCVRAVNQDRWGEFVDDDAGYRLLIVADGMGGHRGGEVASQATVDRVGEVFRRGVPVSYLAAMRRDHGYNPTPAWTATARLFNANARSRARA